MSIFSEMYKKPTQTTYHMAVGEHVILCPFSPTSFQADPKVVGDYKARLQEVTSELPTVFTGSLSASLVWFISPERLYEHGHRSDIDNVLKATLDALSGTQGVWVDDTQLLYVSSEVVLERDLTEDWFVLRIQFPYSDWTPKTKPFVDIDGRFCHPNPDRYEVFQLGKDLHSSGYEQHGEQAMSVGRPFLHGHVTRGGFSIVDKSGNPI